MNKILTISIAAYNVENYIRKALDSLIDERIIDDLEIFVIDDGGTDHTLDIAKEYAKKYPNSIFPIHKNNGGYGSTINYSTKHATGKYFKQLDGDDWFDKEGLYHLVTYLKKTDVDVICTPMLKVYNTYKILRETKANIRKNEVLKIADVLDKKISFAMWEVAYKTEVILTSNMILPEKRFYTDQYYHVIPFSKAKTILILDECVYCYRIGIDGQSISKEARAKHVLDELDNIKDLSKFCEDQKNLNNENYIYILNRIKTDNIFSLKNIFLCGINKASKTMLVDYDNEIKKLSPDVYALDLPYGRRSSKFILLMKILRKSKYHLFWTCKFIPQSFFYSM